MKITIIAIGTRGDIQPCVALAKELVKKKTEVFVTTYKEYKDLVISNNISFIEMPANPANQKREKNSDESNDNKNKLKSYEDYLKVWLVRCLDICKDSDAIIYTPPFLLGSHLAEKLNIPYFPINYAPDISTKEFPSPYLNIVKNLGSILNRFSHTYTDYFFWISNKKLINRLRENVLNYRQHLKVNPSRKIVENRTPFLCCYSPNIQPKPLDWYSEIQVNGYWYLDEEEIFKPTKQLTKYLNAGDKPLYIDFGSYSNKIFNKKIGVMLNDLAKCNERVLIDISRMETKNLQLPQNSFLIKEHIPHKWLLPKVKAIIVHGGVGVIHAAAIAGVPTIPISVIKPQIFWGKKYHQLKLGTSPMEIKKLKSGDLLNAIDYLNTNHDIFTNAKELQKKVVKEKGGENSAECIMVYLRNYYS